MNLFQLKNRNRQHNKEEWSQGLLRLSTLPVRMTLNLSTKCNLRCKMCQFHRTLDISKRSTARLGELPEDVFVDFADEVFPTLLEAETTTIGEPILSSYLGTIITKAEEHGVKLYFTTNAHLLSEQVLAKLMPVLSKLVVSIDAVDPKLYESIRCGGSFEKLQQGITRFLEMRNSLESESPPELTLQMTLMRSNVEELPKMVDLAASWGAENVKAYHAYIYDQLMMDESLFYHKELCNRCIQSAITKAAKTGVKLSVPRPFKEGNTLERVPRSSDFHVPPCRFLWTESFLEPTGDVAACFFPYRRSVGSIKTNSFAEIWNGRDYRLLREYVSNEPPSHFCKSCDLRYSYLDFYSGPGINVHQFLLFNSPLTENALYT